MELVNVSAGRNFTVDQRSFSQSVYQTSLPRQILLSLGWGPSLQQRLLAAARRLAADVQAREAIALARLVGDTGATRPAEVEFTQPALLHWRTDGGARRGNLSQIQGYYQELQRGRLVVQGPAGAGKTVLAIALTRDLAAGFLHTYHDASTDAASGGGTGRRAVAVRVSAAAFDPTGGSPLNHVRAEEVAVRLDDWLAMQLHTVYGVGERDAAALVAEGWILPVLDGLDEMDSPEKPPWRAAAVLAALSHPVRSGHGGLRPVVVTCRTERYNHFAAPLKSATAARSDEWAGRNQNVLQDATVVQVEALTPTAVREYLLFRFPDPAGTDQGQSRWRPILDRLTFSPHHTGNPPTVQAGRGGGSGTVVVAALRSPLRLFLAVDGYRDPASNPDELTLFPDAHSLDAHLFELLIPASTGLHPRPGGGHYTSRQVSRWLGTLARQLDEQDRAGGSSTDLLLEQLWRAAGTRLPRYVTAVILTLACVASQLGVGITYLLKVGLPDNPFAALAVPAGVAAVVMVARRAMRPDTELELFDFRIVRTRHGRRWLAGGLAAGLVLGLVLGLTFAFVLGYTGRDPARGLAGGLVIGLALGLALGIGVRPQATSSPRQLVIQGVTHTLGTLAVAVALGVAAGQAFGTVGGVMGGLAFGLTLGLLNIRNSPWPRYCVACVLLSRQGRLPWRSALFLDWAYQAGLLRVAGLAVQFRHREFQTWLTEQTLPEGDLLISDPVGLGRPRQTLRGRRPKPDR